MFADDLSSWRAGFSKITIEKDFQLFLDQILEWNTRLRMNVIQNKTVYNSYKKNKNVQKLNLNCNGKQLSRDTIPKFLGAHLDSRLNFSIQNQRSKKIWIRESKF